MRTPIALAAALALPVLVATADDHARYADTVERLASPLVESGLVPGLVVGIWKDGEAEYHALGTLTPGGETAPDERTIYEIGSISKVFTATLLAEAARRGELSLDDQLGAHTPEGVAAPKWEEQPITLAMLADHTSALPRLPANLDAENDDPYAAYDEGKLWAFIGGYELMRTPGEMYAYSNLGSGLLGTILVRDAEMDSYEALLKARIAGPLKMHDTVIELSEEQSERLAPPHLSGGTPSTNWTFDALAGAGAIRSTARDLVRFGVAQLETTETDLDAAIAQTHGRRATLPQGGWIALGWHIAGDGSTLTHAGQTGGYAASIYVSEPLNLVVAALTNASEGRISAAAEHIVQSIAGLPVEPMKIRETVEVGQAALERLAGTYTGVSVPLTYSFTVEDGALIAQLPGQPALRVWPASETKFFYREVEAELVFEMPEEGDGAAKAVKLFQGGQEIRFERTD